MSAVAPFSEADTATAHHWLEYVSAAYCAGTATVAEADAKARREIAALERHGLISGGAATLLLQIFDLAPLDLA